MKQVAVQFFIDLVFGDLISQRDSPWHQLTDGSLHFFEKLLELFFLVPVATRTVLAHFDSEFVFL